MLLVDKRPKTESPESTSFKQFLVAQICELFTAAPLNGIVTHEMLSELTGHDTRKSDGQHLVQKARGRVLKDHQIVMASVRGVGWKRIESPEIVKIGPVTMRQARRVTARGIAKLMCADFNSLSNKDKIAHSTSMSVLGTLQLMASRPTISRVEKRILANNNTDPLSEAAVIRFMSE